MAKQTRSRVHGNAGDGNAWVLIQGRCTTEQVCFACTGCGRYVLFMREGHGSPSATETEVPWDAHVYCGDTCDEHEDRQQREDDDGEEIDHHTVEKDELDEAMKAKTPVTRGKKPERPGHR